MVGDGVTSTVTVGEGVFVGVSEGVIDWASTATVRTLDVRSITAVNKERERKNFLNITFS
jgi:hypothetical protein